MKKGLFLFLSLCLSGIAFAQSENEEVLVAEQDTIVKGVHPYKIEENKRIKPEIAHWSIIPHFGFNAFDGDFTNEMAHNIAIPSAGINVEYNFTPIWNIGVEYMYNMYTVYGKTGQTDAGTVLQNADTLLSGHLHRAGAYLSLDLINLFFPRAEKKIVSLLPYVGGGAAWYKRYKYFLDDKWYDAEHGKWQNDTHARGNTANYINADGEVGPEHDTDYRMIGYIQAGAALDFNVNRTIALGLRANYTYFTRDYMDGRGYHKQSSSSYASKNNDGIFDITAYVRFKLQAVSKSHPRNMPSFKLIDDYVAKNGDGNGDGKCCGQDTVIIRHDSIIIREKETTIIQRKPLKEVFNVYFDNDKYVLRQDALATIQTVADRMEGDPELYAVVIGYCDNTGGNGHNFKLGDNRGAVVVDELAKEYNIPEDHLFGKGAGKLVGRRSSRAYGPNRRSAIHLVDKETFELMKLQLNDMSDNRDESIENTFENSRPIRVPVEEKEEPEIIKIEGDSVITIPLSQTAEQEKVNEYKERKHETVVTEKGTTLAQLARKYYSNPTCWVFIYAANKDKIATPNAIPEGTELIIPELTEDELKLKREDFVRTYREVTNHK